MNHSDSFIEYRMCGLVETVGECNYVHLLKYCTLVQGRLRGSYLYFTSTVFVLHFREDIVFLTPSYCAQYLFCAVYLHICI